MFICHLFIIYYCTLPDDDHDGYGGYGGDDHDGEDHNDGEDHDGEGETGVTESPGVTGDAGKMAK